MADTQDIAIVNARLIDPATGREGAGPSDPRRRDRRG
jgi:hypothetical protein